MESIPILLLYCSFSFNKGKRGEWVADDASESRLKIWEKEEGGGGKCIRRGRGGGGRAGERRGSGESSGFLGVKEGVVKINIDEIRGCITFVF